VNRPLFFIPGYYLFPDPPPFSSRKTTILQLRSVRLTEEEILTLWLIYLPGAFVCEYKLQERIHRAIADTRLLAIPAS